MSLRLQSPMATAKKTLISVLQSISLSSSSSSSSRCFAARSLSLPHARPSCLLRLCPLLATIVNAPLHLSSSGSFQCFSTRPATSSLNDPSPNWSNRPPKETILLDGCDFEHWLIVMEPPEPTLTRDEIIDGYIKTLAQVLGSEEEARMSIYSVSTKHYFAFGCKVSEELSYKIKPLPKVRWVLPDPYLDVKNKDYGGEPFIDGKAIPYDPKYHEEWVRNNARAQERSRRSDRPRNFDRSRNFERRRENMQNFQNRETPGPPDKEFQNLTPPNAQNARDVPPMPNRDANAMPPNVGGMPNYQNQLPNAQGSYVPNAGLNHQGSSQGYQGGPGYQGGGQGYQGGNSMGNMPAPGYQGGGPGYQGGGQGYQGGNPMGNMPSPGYQGVGRGHQGGAHGGYQGAHQGDSPNYQAGNPPYQGSLSGYQQGNSIYQGGGPNYQPGGVGYQGGAPGYHGRDISGREQ